MACAVLKLVFLSQCTNNNLLIIDVLSHLIYLQHNGVQLFSFKLTLGYLKVKVKG